MGVRGLTTYINYNQESFLRDFLLYDTTLVIDGHSLCAQLYHTQQYFSAFGGDYDRYFSFVKTFFKNLKKCKITSYVIFDGSVERKKMKTVYSRLRSKIKGASRIDPVTQGSLQIFPLLLRDVFKEVLFELNIPFTVCEFEADEEIAALARHLNCPVLSYDSDFFIYNIQYVPFNTLALKPKIVTVDNKNIHAMDCKIYKVQYLCDSFGGLKEELLPLLATLLGNDYIEKRVFHKFFTQMKLPKGRKMTNEQQRCIHGLFQWLQNESLESAVSKVLGRIKKKDKHKLMSIIKKSIQSYNRTQCESIKYFNICNERNMKVSAINEFGESEIDLSDKEINEFVISDKSSIESSLDSNDQSENENSLEMDSTDDQVHQNDCPQDNVNSLPDWISVAIRNNNIPRSYINLITHHLYFCSPQAEDYNDSDSFLCCLPILRYAFDILTDFSNERLIYVSRDNGCKYERLSVDEEYATTRMTEKKFADLTDEEKKLYFTHFLEKQLPNLDFSLLNLLPLNFQLYMICILYWVKNCSVPIGHVHTLILSYVMLGVIDEKTGSYRGQFHFNKKYCKKIEELQKKALKKEDNSNELLLNKNKVQYEDCLIAASAFLKNFDLDENLRKKPKSYEPERVHSFAQFQCCLQQLNYLNVLCCKPFECVRFSNYNGTFIYNIAMKMEMQSNEFEYLKKNLIGAGSVLKFYKSLFDIYQKCRDAIGLKNVIWSMKKRKRRKKVVSNDEASFLVQGFESEVFI